MKRLFVSLMVIGGSILFGMQAAESAPKKQTIRRLTQRAERCAKRAKTEKENKRCFDRLAMEESKTARLRREKACRELSPVAKKACLRRFFVEFRAKQRVLARSRGTLIFLLAPKCGKLNPKAKAACFARARVKDRVRTRVKARVRDRVNKSSTAARRDCNRFTTERARKTCRGLPAARARAKAAGCSKIRDKDKKSICFRQAKMCGDLRDPKKIAKCRARVTPRHLGRKRCDRIKSLGARAACCAKIRPASRLSPKKKLCRPVFARCGKIRNPKVKAACVARNRVKARVRDRLKGRRTERK